MNNEKEQIKFSRFNDFLRKFKNLVMFDWLLSYSRYFRYLTAPGQAR